MATRQPISEVAQLAIKENIFSAAHGAIENWGTFAWHCTNGEPDTHVANSSQAFCISVWGTFASARGVVVRSAVIGLLNDLAFTEAIRKYPAEVPLQFESVNRA